MSDYKEALAFQRVMIESSRDRDWQRRIVELMHESKLSKSQAQSSLALVLYLFETTDVYYLPQTSFERVEQHASGTVHRNYLSEVVPTPEGMIVFENDILPENTSDVAFSAIFWKVDVTTELASDPANIRKGMALILIYRLVHGIDPDALYATPLLICDERDGEIVITPSYTDPLEKWQHRTDGILQYFGLVCLFMKQRIAAVTTQTAHSSRVVGRKRVHSTQSVKLVTLRAIERTVQPMSAEQHSREYSCRWEVRAHDRHLRDGRIVRVKKHEKGPPDAPKREYAKTVYNVSR